MHRVIADCENVLRRNYAVVREVELDVTLDRIREGFRGTMIFMLKSREWLLLVLSY